MILARGKRITAPSYLLKIIYESGNDLKILFYERLHTKKDMLQKNRLKKKRKNIGKHYRHAGGTILRKAISIS